MNSQKSITLKLTGSLNKKGYLYFFSVSLDPRKADGNGLQSPIELKKGEIERMIKKLSKTEDIINSKDVNIYVAIQNKKFVDNLVCKGDDNVNPPPTPRPKGAKPGISEQHVEVISAMFAGLKVMVKEVKA